MGQLEAAEEELVASEAQAREFLAEEGESAEDIDEEIGIIRVSAYRI